ncbi:hypothetical protein [Dactylosporangium darangshiense]|uniref:hypothetical protein n=1 Tax=Dactylosporangium darangshiense TaxID=579108 RepID=UPI0031EDCC82
MRLSQCTIWLTRLRTVFSARSSRSAIAALGAPAALSVAEPAGELAAARRLVQQLRRRELAVHEEPVRAGSDRSGIR